MENWLMNFSLSKDKAEPPRVARESAKLGFQSFAKFSFLSDLPERILDYYLKLILFSHTLSLKDNPKI